VMSAGTGIRHAEYNREGEPTRLFQIWIIPDERGGAPSWDTRPFPKGDRAGHFVTLASGMVDDGEALPIRTSARVLGATLKTGQSAEYRLGSGRHAYLVPAAGAVEVNGVAVEAGDGVAIRDEPVLRVAATKDAEIVLVDTE
jgi:redox-sensitive bicupin YhaK (pirin superfamily)